MNRHLKTLNHFVILIVLTVSGSAALATESTPVTPGSFLGAKDSTHPGWFKESFLEFEEDIGEATDANKRLVLYFHQAGCPYCNKLMEDNFADPVIAEKFQTHFDIVALNMWGDRDVVQVGGQGFTEKTLAEALNVDFTPTLLFFNEKKKVVMRMNGYYPPVQFDRAMDYVSQKQENNGSFAEYINNLNQSKAAGSLANDTWLLEAPYGIETVRGKPTAILFEEADCDHCQLLHDKSFRDPAAASLLNDFTIVQLNRWSENTITDIHGNTTTPRDWAKSLGLGFSPAIVLFDENRQHVITIDAMFKTFHVLGVLDYVSSKAYLQEPSFQRYLSARAEHIIESGQDVDIWKY